MKQKIGIIQALMTRPPVVILDEPTAGLDPLMVQAFRETVAELRQRGDTTVFLSSHVLTEVEATCDRIGLIRGGRIVTSGTIEDLKRDATRRVVVFFGTPVTRTLSTPGIAVRAQGPTRWELDVRGPLGPLIEDLAGLPVLDVQVEPFRLEEYVTRFYAETAGK
jgi:ABC-2 type transport system ATP-binding protein